MFARLFSRKSKYDLDSIEGIQAIEIPKYKKLKGVGTPVNNIEYILQRKATEYMKLGESELALACLRKSNEIFPHSNFMWSQNDYLRLVEYLKKIRRFEEAREEQKKIDQMFIEDDQSGLFLELAIRDAKSAGSDLIITGENDCLCSECALFTRRIYSISGRDRRFPKIPERLFGKRDGHEYCINDYYSYFYPESIPTWKYKGDLLSWCLRPYSDERTNKQKAVYKDRVRSGEQEILDRNNYDLIWEKLPDIAPKSFGGFMRMKNQKTTNYEKLRVAARSVCDLEAKPDLSGFRF